MLYSRRRGCLVLTAGKGRHPCLRRGCCSSATSTTVAVSKTIGVLLTDTPGNNSLVESEIKCTKSTKYRTIL